MERRGLKDFPCVSGKVPGKGNMASFGRNLVSREARSIPCEVSSFFPAQPLYFLDFFSCETGLHTAQAGLGSL